MLKGNYKDTSIINGKPRNVSLWNQVPNISTYGFSCETGTERAPTHSPQASATWAYLPWAPGAQGRNQLTRGSASAPPGPLASRFVLPVPQTARLALAFGPLDTQLFLPETLFSLSNTPPFLLPQLIQDVCSCRLCGMPSLIPPLRSRKQRLSCLLRRPVCQGGGGGAMTILLMVMR